MSRLVPFKTSTSSQITMILCAIGLGACNPACGIPPAPPRDSKPGQVWHDPHSGMDFCYCPPGNFLMGSNYGDPDYTTDQLPQHKVTISKGFWLGRTTVTQEQWEGITKENPSHFKGKDLPVENVSWFDCQSFLNKLRPSGGTSYRLPTEAEWEYACRAASAEPSAEEIDSIAWYKFNCAGTQPVAKKKPNAWGLYDMHGNVRQWCSDWRGPYSATPVTDPQGAANGNYKMIRGSSWYSTPHALHSYARWHYTPDFKVDEVGVRVVLVTP